MQDCSSTGCAARHTCVLNTRCTQSMHTTQAVTKNRSSTLRPCPRRGCIEQVPAGVTHTAGGHVPKMVLCQILQADEGHEAQQARHMAIATVCDGFVDHAHSQLSATPLKEPSRRGLGSPRGHPQRRPFRGRAPPAFELVPAIAERSPTGESRHLNAPDTTTRGSADRPARQPRGRKVIHRSH